VLIDHVLQQRAQCQDVKVATPDIARLQQHTSRRS
jgi:hypothetical protein